MRRKKHKGKIYLYALGMLVGYGVTLIVSMICALILSFFDGAARTAGAAAVLSLSVGSYFCGRTVGIIQRKNGLKIGFLCGLSFSAVPIVLSLVFGEFSGTAIAIKIAMCAAFGVVGGVAGVNADEK